MKKYLLTTTAAGAAIAMASPAMAGSYVSIFGGYSMNDQTASARIAQNSGTFAGSETGYFYTFGSGHFHYNASYTSYHVIVATFSNFTTVTHGSWVSATDADFEANDGFVVGAALGKEIAPGLRGELEISYRKHDVDARGTSYFSSEYSGTVFWKSYHLHDYIHVTYATSMAPVSTSEVVFSGTTHSLSSGSMLTKGGGSFTSTTFTDSGDISALSIMANVWLDVDLGLGANVHPYVGAGVGYADVTLNIGGIDEGDTAVAFQVGAGVGFDLPNTGHSINVEVRRFVVPKLDITHNGWDIPLDYETTDFIVSYRINF